MSPAKKVDIVMNGLTWPPESGAAAHMNNGSARRLMIDPRIEAVRTLAVSFLTSSISSLRRAGLSKKLLTQQEP